MDFWAIAHFGQQTKGGKYQLDANGDSRYRWRHSKARRQILDLLRRLEEHERRRTAFINADGDLHEAFVDDALADTDTDTAINAAHTAIAINAGITAHIVIDSDTAIDINTVININAASDIAIAISAAAATVRGQASIISPSRIPHLHARDAGLWRRRPGAGHDRGDRH